MVKKGIFDYILILKNIIFLMYISIQKFGVRNIFIYIFKEVSSAQQDCIYLIIKYSKN